MSNFRPKAQAASDVESESSSHMSLTTTARLWNRTMTQVSGRLSDVVRYGSLIDPALPSPHRLFSS